MQVAVSLVLITKNAGRQLETCLSSVPFADEIVIVDSGSTDDTETIARNYGARFIHNSWCGFGPQKRFAVNAARNDWVLCLDADEWLSDELSLSIKKILNNPQADAYRFPRCNKFMGRFLRYGEGYPDWSLRLFNRTRANWSEDLVHEFVKTDSAVENLSGDLMHESGEDIARYLDKQNRYTTLQAEGLFACGKRAGFGKMLVSPLVRFVKFYLVRQGFRDGLPGFVHIAIGCMNSFMKYAKLIELYRLENKQ
ncbi:glycosyltransferase family 2 protein [Paludibacterium paludis]|uniref:LPS biosynthesis protein n=1 Tax=Paludibacterium paludis TaxID=1225769 RepID=A0A918P168_9NEIS|nr:glycosyltransferase family 2 protein [Paludibacterium paludis]GGY12442.1 LPS biosynthesis protein [Paludibacterium paludis]